MTDFFKNNKRALILFGTIIILTGVNLIQDLMIGRDVDVDLKFKWYTENSIGKKLDLPYYISEVLGRNRENLIITFIRWISFYLAISPFYNELPKKKKYYFTKKISPILVALTTVTSRDYKFAKINSYNAHLFFAFILIVSNGIFLFPINKIHTIIYFIFASLYVWLFSFKRVFIKPNGEQYVPVNEKIVKYLEYVIFIYYSLCLDGTNYKK